MKMIIKLFLSVILAFAACQAEPAPKILQVGVCPDLPPLFFLENGLTVGFDVDLIAAVSERAGLQYQLVQISPISQLLQSVQDNVVDLAISGITINADRRAVVDFSVPYLTSRQAILVPEGSPVTNAQDLLDKIVAVRIGTTGQAAVLDLFGGQEANIRTYNGVDEAGQALVSRAIDAYVDDDTSLNYWARNNPGYVVVGDSSFPLEFFGIVFAKGNPLRDQFNPIITDMLINGDYNVLSDKWFGETEDVDLLLLAGEYDDPYLALNGEDLALNGEDWEYLLV